MNNAKNKSETIPSQQVHDRTLAVPYGRLQLNNATGAYDHANMRVDQLDALLIMISGEGQQAFACLHDNEQNSVLWLLQSMAHEVRQIMPLLATNESGVAA